MTFEIRINIDAPRAGLRRLALFVGLPLALVGVTAAIAHAYDPTFATAGQTVKAAPLKTALDDIQSRLVALESPVIHTVITYGSGVQYSLGATFKSITPGPGYDGLFVSPSGKTGYAAGKEICEQVTGSKSAHVCTSDEAVRSAAVGNPIVGSASVGGLYTWISTGVFSYTGKPGPYMSDCQGFTTANSGEYANTYYGGAYPWVASCDGKYPIACCDLSEGPRKMDINIRLTFDAPRAGLRRLALFVGLPLALVGVTAAIAHAYDTSFATAGQPVKAAALKTALDDIQSWLVKPTITKNGKTISLGATFCGVTPSPFVGGSIGGYEKAAQNCLASPECGGSPSVHMCTAEEMLRSSMLGIDVPSAWYSSGTSSYSYNNSMVLPWDDCSGWTSAGPNEAGPQWKAGGKPGPGYGGCSGSGPIACCD